MRGVLLFTFSLAVVTPLAGQCTYQIAPTSINIPANGGTGIGVTASITVTTNLPSCAWTYSTDSPSWITLSVASASGATVNGSAPLSVAASPSTLPAPRTGNVLIQNGNSTATIPVTQAGSQCSMTLNPASSTLPASGGSSTFAVQTGCTWAATSNVPWITVAANDGGSGTGNGTVTYTAASNACTYAQTGTIVVSSLPNQIFTVTENGSPNNLSLSPSATTAPQAGGPGRFNVVTGGACSWSAFADVNWLHITANASGTGNGGLPYSVDANPGAARTGNIHVGPQLFAVSQAGVSLPAMQLSAVENAASYAAGAVAPGEIVALFGMNMGPATGMSLQLSANGQAISNAIGGVQVLFDGSPAPLIYVSAGQINAIAPVGLAGKASTQVQVSYQNGMSNTMTIPVAAGAPGIFAADGSGVGGGAILNQDYSVNARLNPAARGSVVAIYLTGAGATNPASADGAVTGGAAPFPAVTQTVGVTIGGVPVPAEQIVYSGAAPGSVEGLVQIDAVVPQSVTPGASVPIVVTIGGVSSQPGITLSVN